MRLAGGRKNVRFANGLLNWKQARTDPAIYRCLLLLPNQGVPLNGARMKREHWLCLAAADLPRLQASLAGTPKRSAPRGLTQASVRSVGSSRVVQSQTGT